MTEAGKTPKEIHEEKMAAQAAELQEIIRVAGTDLPGRRPLVRGLGSIKGVSYTFANAFLHLLGFDHDKRVGDLTEKEIEQIETALKNPASLSMPDYLLNRRKDPESGENRHLTGPELDLTKEFDVRRMRKMRSYKGIRHGLGLPVRGQRTKTSFRKGAKVGVTKKGRR